MSNPLFSALGGQQTVKNPKQEVERLLQSGAMSQQDFNRLGQMANQMMGRK